MTFVGQTLDLYDLKKFYKIGLSPFPLIVKQPSSPLNFIRVPKKPLCAADKIICFFSILLSLVKPFWA